MEYTLFQDFARKIPLPAPPSGRPGRTQSGRTPEFSYGPLLKMARCAFLHTNIYEMHLTLWNALTFIDHNIRTKSPTELKKKKKKKKKKKTL